MTPLKVYETSKLENKNSWEIVGFILKMRQLETKNPPKFENYFKWPTFTPTALKAKLVYRKGGANRPKSPVSKHY